MAHHSITKEELSEYFDMPIKIAAAKLGVCTTLLKKMCRNNGIPRWPHRKIHSLNRSIQQLEATLGRNPEEDAIISKEIATRKGQINLLRTQPHLVVNIQRKRKRVEDHREDCESNEVITSKPFSQYQYQNQQTPPSPKRIKQDIIHNTPHDLKIPQLSSLNLPMPRPLESQEFRSPAPSLGKIPSISLFSNILDISEPLPPLKQMESSSWNKLPSWFYSERETYLRASPPQESAYISSPSPPSSDLQSKE
eukprot:TRINITY_DN2039_c0_g1_i2.p1 TRINITY_DN2039_c0_g1~~TRINITY_DN2039_c0_g1_i2.p1  ORF type:complete len:251 (+),score=20.35 TRINITY_DN2039_c0_g1_i2:19-771(+)